MEKNPVWGTVVWPLADQVKNLLEKKCSGMASGGLMQSFEEGVPFLVHLTCEIFT